MVVKTLTITEKAYEALKGLKYTNESFSEVVFRLSEEKKGNITKFYGALSESKNLEGLKNRIKGRRKEIDKEFILRERKIKK